MIILVLILLHYCNQAYCTTLLELSFFSSLSLCLFLFLGIVLSLLISLAAILYSSFLVCLWSFIKSKKAQKSLRPVGVLSANEVWANEKGWRGRNKYKYICLVQRQIIISMNDKYRNNEIFFRIKWNINCLVLPLQKRLIGKEKYNTEVHIKRGKALNTFWFALWLTLTKSLWQHYYGEPKVFYKQ